VAAVTPENRTFDPVGLLRLLDGRYADGRLSGPRCKAITREVNRLCNETRLCAGALVDAFGIPDEMLGAPIGLSDDGPARD